MDDRLEQLLDGREDSRRSFMKKGALASGALALGASGTTVAQEDGETDGTDDEADGATGGLDDEWQGLIFVDAFNPNARFAFVSDVVDWTPAYGDVQDSWFADYNTYHIRWLNTDEIVPLFVAEDANVGEYDSDLGFVTDTEDQNQPQLFEVDRDWAPFGDNERLVNVNVSPVDEDVENDILETDDWWEESDQDGTDGTDGADGTDETDGADGTETDGADGTDETDETDQDTI